MEINFIGRKESINPLWKQFMEKIFSLSDGIKMAYSAKVGHIKLEFDPLETGMETEHLKFEIKLDDFLSVEILYKAVIDCITGLFGTKGMNFDGFVKNSACENGTRFFVNYINKKELKINLQNDITTYLHYHLQLCAALSDERLKPWFYEHFINICLRKDQFGFYHKKGSTKVDYVENKFLFSDISYSSFYGYETMDAISTDAMDFIRGKLDTEHYVIIYLDGYFISNKEIYRKWHYVHQSLIYGYDNEDKVFLTVSFDKNNALSKMRYLFNEVAEAFESAKIHYPSSAPWSWDSAIQLFKLKNYEQYPEFHLNIFIKKLDDFIFSRPRQNDVYNILAGEEVLWGIDIYDEIILQIKSLPKGESNIDYRAFHLLCEHKKAIYRRLLFIAEKYRICEKLYLLIQEYAKLANSFNGIRLNVLKRCLEGCEIYAGMYELPKDVGFAVKTVSSLRRNAIIERNLILKLQDEFNSCRIEARSGLYVG